jgi:hypothetical protein
VDGGVLAENVRIADFEVGRLAGVLEVLGLAADVGEGKKLIFPAKGRVAFEDDVSVENALVAEGDVVADDAVRADSDIPTELSKG